MAGFFAIGFLRMFSDNNFALENAARIVIHHAFKKFAAGAMRNEVVDGEASVGVLFAFEQISAGDFGFGVFAVEIAGSVLAGEGCADSDRYIIQPRIFTQIINYM